ncbi:hypothetical protein CMV_021254 [Castanea mollissima]|uniref:Uncharacterized protein n=1 Tax=Castanea mollissima TaxID=60419 RepID=A0A8J4QUP8_9ROSI|nr:hypothetical protein CMV_021254 [Castanea mollissima]
MMEGGVRYLEVKQLLLLLYHQAITFYLLKSEGQPIRDHPVLARLVEIKSLLDKESGSPLKVVKLVHCDCDYYCLSYHV